MILEKDTSFINYGMLKQMSNQTFFIILTGQNSSFTAMFDGIELDKETYDLGENCKFTINTSTEYIMEEGTLKVETKEGKTILSVENGKAKLADLSNDKSFTFLLDFEGELTQILP